MRIYRLHNWALSVGLVAAGTLQAFGPLSSLPGYSSRIWHTVDGLPEDSIQALAQTRDGYLWIGTSGGLVRFDGVRFVVFSRESTAAFRENSISALLAAKDGSLWIGTQGGGVVRYREGKFHAFGAAEGLTNEFAGTLYQDRAGRVWVGTDWGVFRFEHNRFVRMDRPEGTIPAMWAYGMIEDREGRMWISGAGLIAARGDASMVYYTGRKNDFFRPVMETPDGAIYAGSITGLERLAPGAREFRKIEPRNVTIRTLVLDSAGNFWVGTARGLILDRDGRQTTFTAPDALPDNQVTAFLEDSEHNLWIGTGNGLVRWSPSAVSSVTTDARPNDDNIRTVYEDRQGLLWVVTTSGHIYQLRAGFLKPANLPAEALSVPARSLFEDSRGRRWIGTDGLGVLLIDHGKVSQFKSSNGGPSNGFTTAFCEDPEGTIWIGTEGGLARYTGSLPVTRYHPNRPEFGPGFRGLPYATIRALLVDREGDLWIGTDGGLARYRQGVFAFDRVIDQLRNRKIWAIDQDFRGDIWLGTRGDGVFRIQNGRLTRFTTANGLPSNYVYQILSDSRGSLFLASPSGVYTTHLPAPGESRLNGTFDSLAAGLLVGGVQPVGVMTGAGELWLASTAGVVRLSRGHLAPKAAPPVVIEELIADGRQIPPASARELGPGNGELEVRYTAVRLGPTGGLRFRYRLDGFDRDWVEVLGEREAHYTNLGPGHYTFRVEAYDSSGTVPITRATLDIGWRPHVYQSWWFFALLLGCVVGAAGQFYRARTQRERMRRAVLEERNRLAREMHDTLVQGCVGAVSMLEAADSLQSESPQRAHGLVAHAREQIRATIDEARDAIWNLRGKSAENLGARLAELAHGMSRDNSIAIRLHMKGTPGKLSVTTEDNLLLVAREALLNALRHGSPTRIDLDLRYASGSLEMKIADNGCGFSTAAWENASGRHYGLIGMRERAEALGGALSITSANRKGTVVGVKIPTNPGIPQT